MFGTRSILIGIVFGVAVASCVYAEQVIELPADPPRVERWSLQSVWQIDVEDPDTPLIGDILRATYDADGNVFLLDSQMKHVLQYSADGRFLGTLGRAGEGPGEVENPFDLFVFSDGTIGLVQSYPRKIAHLNTDGTPASRVPTDNAVGIFRRVRERNGVMVVANQTMDPKRSGKGISTYVHEVYQALPGTEDRIRYLSKVVTTSMSPPTFNEYDAYFPARVWDLKENGEILLAPKRDEYLIECYTPDGDLTASIRRPFEPRRRTNSELKELKESMVFTAGSRRIKPETTLADSEPAVTAIRVADDGSIWIQSNGSEGDLPEGVFASFDVYESDWSWRAQVQLDFEANLDTDRLFPLDHGRFLLVKSAKEAGLGGAKNEDAGDSESMLEIYCLGRE